MHELVSSILSQRLARQVQITDNVSRITNFVIVEITPIGIQNLGWQFWIVWTVFNAVFLPIIYFFYPETCKRPIEASHKVLLLT